MKRWAWGVAATLLMGVVATAVVVAVWASVGDAPWEESTTCAACEVCPEQTHEQLAELACLQGGGDWLGYTANTPCSHFAANCRLCPRY